MQKLFFIIICILALSCAGKPAVIEQSSQLDHPSDWTEPITGMKFVWVPGGCYEMGCGDWTGGCEEDEKPVHEVCVGGFWIGKYEVTQGQWKRIMGSSPSHSGKGEYDPLVQVSWNTGDTDSFPTKGDYYPKIQISWNENEEYDPSYFEKGDEYPVVQVSWNDAKTFIATLNTRFPDRYYRLPTEAEWEYACRSGGKPEKYSGGHDVDQAAWYSSNSDSATHAVGSKAPNGLGIYDMSGNVWEWCADIYDENAYSKHRRENPIVNSGRGDHVGRGGCWRWEATMVRCSYRGWLVPGYSNGRLGFRLVKED
ncbi:MAG: formylglycine-generating enzyme family protein [Deltaproteobacteria bacterium]|nr:formylglycine-generating enzyme family protein [Deltaproteobacteria bacterium]